MSVGLHQILAFWMGLYSACMNVRYSNTIYKYNPATKCILCKEIRIAFYALTKAHKCGLDVYASLEEISYTAKCSH
jgi:hypothetical protein